MTLKMKGEDFPEEKLLDLLRVSKPEGFWLRQRNEILAKIQAPHPSRVSGWRLTPVFAAALAFAFFLFQKRMAYHPHDIPSVHEWAFLEQLDLLEDLDVIEAMNGDDS